LGDLCLNLFLLKQLNQDIYLITFSILLKRIYP